MKAQAFFLIVKHQTSWRIVSSSILQHDGDIGRLAAVELDLEQRVVRPGQVDVDAAPAEVAVADPDILGLPLSLLAEEMEICVK